MRWIALAILTYVLTLLQTSLLDVITIRVSGVGLVRPELLAIVVVYAALNVRSALDAMLTGWALGLVLDITTGAGPEISAVVGPMSLAYALAAGGVYRIRGAVFREKAVTRFVMTLVFCIVTHWTWIAAQWALAFRNTAPGGIARMLVQAMLLALYTAAIAPVAHLGLHAFRRSFIASTAGTMDRRR